MEDSGSGHRQLHFVLLPWLGTSHTIPMIDIGRMLAERGVAVTVVMTPANAAWLSPTISHIADSGLAIRFVTLPFPSAEAGLPEGCESFDSLPSFDMVPNLYYASKLLRHPLEVLLRDLTVAPSCIVSGMFYSWTPAVARELGVPCFVFHGFGAFALFCMHNLYCYKPHESVSSPTEPFTIPDLPFPFEITRQRLPIQFQLLPRFLEMCEEGREGELAMDGIIVNSFDELEPGYAVRLAVASGKEVRPIGPVSLCCRGSSDMAARGQKPSVEASRCMQWLDSMKPRSVVYVSFGSLARFAPAQLMELGHGLLASRRPFIWVINGAESLSEEVEQWLQEKLEIKEVDSRCLLIRGWAPQVMILSHPAVGGFMTHSGWNSTLESASAGVPVASWPLFADQFINQKLIVDVLGIGVAVGVDTSVGLKQAPEDGASVTRDEVAEAIERLMGGGEEGEERRRKAKELAEEARKAVAKCGSSYDNLTLLIESVAQKAKKN
ncbi:UDP-glycosyltransferase 73C3-like [Musa acuminata AAA Group]|uniref:UDP-glycosyltransferase 73C3-like n=1 Tax=Musa acuminata AAA Group TaxID=214697 RepID=UPI0031D0E47F